MSEGKEEKLSKDLFSGQAILETERDRSIEIMSVDNEDMELTDDVCKDTEGLITTSGEWKMSGDTQMQNNDKGSRIKATLNRMRIVPNDINLLEEEEEVDVSGNRERHGDEVSSDPLKSEDVDQFGQFTFLQKKAEVFGLGTSSSDADIVDVDGACNSSSFFTSEQRKSKTGSVSEVPKVEQEQVDGLNLAVEGKESASNKKIENEFKHRLSLGAKGQSPDAAGTSVVESDKSPLINEKNLSLGLEVSGKLSKLSESSHGKQSVKDREKLPLILPSPAKTDVSSEEDSTYLNTSEDIDRTQSPTVLSDGEGATAFSKYSQLSEDGSSSPDKLGTLRASSGREERHVFEHSLELGVAFTEFVNVDSFKETLKGRSPHTEDVLGGKSEEHLLILLQGASRKNLKSYLRHSQWPAESDARRRLWENLCAHLFKAEGNLFNEMAEDMQKNYFSSVDDIIVPSFVERDLIDNYHLNNHGIRTAKLVVAVVGHLHPEIVYCPALYPLTSLFLHYMSPDACFNCMTAVLRSSDPALITQTKVGAEASKYVLRDLAKKYTKQAYVLMVRNSKSVEAVFEMWRCWIFKDLPFQYLVRIIDSFLLEGYKVFYRVALAILYLYAKVAGKRGHRNTPIPNISEAISSFCTNIPYDAKKLLKVGFGIRGLTRKEMVKLQLKHEMYIKSLPLRTDLPKVISMQSMDHVSTSRSFSSPMIVQNVASSIVTADLIPSGLSRGRSESLDLSFPQLGLHFQSLILSMGQMSIVWSWLPQRMSLKKPLKLYTSDDHGTTLRTLYAKSEYAEQTILLIKATSGEIFGAYCSAPWHTRLSMNKYVASFFGTGETFIFSLYPEVRKYPWVGALPETEDPAKAKDLFMLGDDTRLIIGSGDGEAIHLDEMMDRCRSMSCQTFGNKPLCEGEDFKCAVVEVYSLVD